jgi:L-arabinose isomerase
MGGHCKPKIGLLGLMLELYDKSNPELRSEQEEFAEQLVGKLTETMEVKYCGIVNTRAGVDAAMAVFDAADVDLLIVVHFSYSPSLIAMAALIDCKLPIVLFNTQRKRGIDDTFCVKDVMQNHGMHGQQDLANVLVRNGRDFGVVTGYWQDEETLDELGEWAQAAVAAKRMRRTEVGLIGYPFQDMGDFGVDETTFMAQVGPHVQHIGLDELAEAMAEAPEAELAEIVASDRQHFEVTEKLTEAEHLASARSESALRKVVADRRLDAIAIHYEVLGADPRFTALPFTAVTKLITEGIGFGGEGDITSASCVTAMHYLTGLSTFTEMFCMDFIGGTVLMSHFAEGNLNFAADRPKMIRREGWVGSGGVSSALAFSFTPGPVTMVNLTIGAGGKAKLIATTAQIQDYALPDGMTPHCRLKPDCDLRTFLDAYLHYGGSHHVALVEDNRLSLVEKFAGLMGLELAVI